jgi:hypothetical protein
MGITSAQAGKLKLIYLSFSPPNSFTHVPLNTSEVEIARNEHRLGEEVMLSPFI